MTLILFFTWLLAACASFAPHPLDSPREILAFKSQEQQGVRVSVAIPSDDQARRHFGVDLAAHDLQAIWVRIENSSPRTLWFLIAALDPDYYSANEAAALFYGDLDDEDDARLSRYFREHSPRLRIEPGQTSEGYLFSRRTEGGRYVNVELSGQEKLLRFGFALPLADGNFDFERLHPERIYGAAPRPDLDAAGLRTALRGLPCCTANSDGSGEGDPLNIAIVGNLEPLMTALARSGWSFTHRLGLDSIRRMVAAAIAGDPYPVAPVSSLYLFGRPQDIALQRARSSISQRNHMRLWLAPFRFEGRSVWVGQISRDIGVKLTSKSPTLTTHVIDPQVDEAREYLLQSLLVRHGVERFGFVTGVGVSTPEQPRMNLTDDPWLSDGLRLVVVLADDSVPPHKALNFHWQEDAEPFAVEP